jgi:hypothetical protein
MFRSAAITLTLCLATVTADAALLSRAGGQAYYDDVLNITWLRNANLAATNSFGVAGIIDAGEGPGQMTWATAQLWVGAMNAADYLGVNNWRLPETLQPDPTCSQQYGDKSYGHTCQGSEMGHLFYVNGISWGAGGSGYSGGFTNIHAGMYWSGTEYALDPSFAWNNNFHVGYGDQVTAQKSNYDFAWAVHDGDPFSVVPVPAAVWLFGSALGVVGLLRRRSPA